MYRYSWDRKLLEEYPWPDFYTKQPEALAYLEHVVDRYDLRKDMSFETDMTDATWNEEHKIWQVTTNKGEKWNVTYLITAMGILSTIQWPDVPNRETFKGEMYHTGAWPDKHDFSNKRVGVIGNGSTGVQTITAIAPQVKELYSFQRSPQYTVSSYFSLNYVFTS